MKNTASKITKSQVAAVEKNCRCNKNHSGNRGLTFSAGYFECAGCGEFHTPEAALSALAGSVQDFDGAGGLIRAK